MSHAGIHLLMSTLRETFWILKSRATIPKALYACVRCGRLGGKRLQTVPATLPENRGGPFGTDFVPFNSRIFYLVLEDLLPRRGRPSIIYSDKGSNFVRSNNLLRSINWNTIEIEAATNKIDWKFSPPAAPWWDGFWERLVQMIKKLLRRVLRQSCLNYEKFMSVLCDCEATVNARPLTYVSEDSDDLIPLTLSLFLGKIPVFGVPDLDHLDK
ncbi:uncharacterized protein LOC118202934, partial [Stegodyphus dumicola]|uniref:uncharacterized protein LOC118202934 n=1 Tax=Stegodyphus dumicola TaxID=202533 RepID=UPI0015ACE62D